jgi:hypothetical protein
MTNTPSGRGWLPARARRTTTAVGLVGGVALCVTAALTLPSAGAATGGHHLPRVQGVPHTDRPLASGPYRLIHKGLDNPRQLSLTHGHGLVVAEAGHGSYLKRNCVNDPQAGRLCIGRTGRVTVLKHGQALHVMTGLLSGASPDGSFATGPDGAAKKPGNGFFAIETYGPPSIVPPGLPARQLGKLMGKHMPSGHLRIAANIARFERNHDPDGEGFDSNPYSVLALRHQTLVADAAGDYIAEVHGRKVSLWAAMPEYGPRIDPVPTVVSRGGDGKIYVGELHSEKKGKAKVYQFNRRGDILRHWNHFTTVTGVARKANGMLYVSELFGGHCSFNQIPSCFPGRVVRVAPDGSRSYFRVPFPAGVVARGNRVQVAAFSIAPSIGVFGNPAWSGQIWRIHF